MRRIKTDSRKIKDGDIFLALRGISSDGHSYIPKAIENGATKVIAEEGRYDVDYEIVTSSREYLNQYLKENYNPCIDEMTLIGITGTNGKTTSAYLIYDALNKLGIKCAYIGTIGFYMDGKVTSLPNTSPEVSEIYNMLMDAYEQGYRYAVLEVSSHGLSNGRIEGLSFDYAVFTNLTQDHLDFHKTMDNYAMAKQSLFYKLKPNGKAIINYDDSYKETFLLEQNNNLTYGFDGGDYQVIEYDMTNFGTKFQYSYMGDKYSIESNLIGKYNIYNLMVAMIVLKEIGISFEQIGSIVSSLQAPVGRMEKVLYGSNSIIVDYAHTPDALMNIISTVKEFCKGKLYVVFGCTGDRDRTKRPIMMDITTRECDYVIVTSDDLHNEDPDQIVSDMLEGLQKDNYEVCMDRRDAIIKGIQLLDDQDVLLILGKGHEEVMIIGNERIPFNDMKTVNAYLDDLNKD